MARQTTLFGADPFALAASVYTTSISMNADSFCGIFDKTSSMHCGKSAFCSYDTKVGRAGCCFTTTSGTIESTVCPFHTACIDHPGTLPSGCVTPCVDFESGIMSCYGGSNSGVCQSYTWTDFTIPLKSYSCGLSKDSFTVGFPETFASFLKTEVLHMTEATTDTTATLATATSRPSFSVASETYAGARSTVSSASTIIASSSATATETTSSSSSSGVSAPVIGTVSSIGAVILAIGLAWFLVKRKRRREDRETKEMGKDDKRLQPAFYSVPDDGPGADSLAPVPEAKHNARPTSELDTQIPKQPQEDQVHELDHQVAKLTDDRHASWAPSELPGSIQSDVPRQRLSAVPHGSYQACDSWSAGELPQVVYHPYRSVRQSKLPEGIAELPA